MPLPLQLSTRSPGLQRTEPAVHAPCEASPWFRLPSVIGPLSGLVGLPSGFVGLPSGLVGLPSGLVRVPSGFGAGPSLEPPSTREPVSVDVPGPPSLPVADEPPLLEQAWSEPAR